MSTPRHSNPAGRALPKRPQPAAGRQTTRHQSQAAIPTYEDGDHAHAAAPSSSFAFSFAPSRQRFAALPLLRAAGFTAVVSVTATLLIRAIALQVVNVPAEFVPLSYASVTSLTIVGVIAATTACFALNRFTRNPVSVFRRVAPVALALSFIPDIAIWLGHAYQHTANASTVTPLLVMHIAVGALCFAILPRAITEPAARATRGSSRDARHSDLRAVDAEPDPSGLDG